MLDWRDVFLHLQPQLLLLPPPPLHPLPPPPLQQLLLPLLCCLGIQASWFVVLIGLERLAEPQPKPALLLSPLRT